MTFIRGWLLEQIIPSLKPFMQKSLLAPKKICLKLGSMMELRSRESSDVKGVGFAREALS